MSEYKIDKGIPIPRPGTAKYPLDEMEIGDSIFIEGKKSDRFGSVIAFYKPKKFVTRTVEENGAKGIRIWRTL